MSQDIYFLRKSLTLQKTRFRMESFAYESWFPVELWQLILFKVPPTDLCNVTLTSTYMLSMASLPEMWAEMKVNMGKVRDNGLAELFNINRFKKIKKINFSGMDFTTEQLEKLMDDIPESPLEDINLNWIDLSGIAADKLARAVSHMHTFNMSYTDMTTDQCVKVLDTSLSSTTLSNLNLGGINLSGIPANLLATAVSRLRNVNLSYTDMTTDQCVQVLDTSLSSTTLTDLDLTGIILSDVPADLLATAVSRLKNVNLTDTQMTTDQCVQVLNTSLSSTTLANLNLVMNDLSGIPADLLATAVSHLKTFDLRFTKMTTDQCVKMLETSLSSTTLSDLNLMGINLNGVPADLLATAVSRLKTVDLWNNQLTSNQCFNVLKNSLLSTTLSHLNLAVNNLSTVPADLLAMAVCRLKTGGLRSTDMTTDQCVKMLETSLSSTTLSDLNLTGTNLNGVPADLLATAVSRLESVDLWNTQLTSNQCFNVLKTSLLSTTLSNLNLGRNNLSTVPADLLAMAVCRLKTVDLSYTDMTTDQCVKMLETILSSTTLTDLDLDGINLNGVPADLLATAVGRFNKLEMDEEEEDLGEEEEDMEEDEEEVEEGEAGEEGEGEEDE